jgi:hypothetical protein
MARTYYLTCTECLFDRRVEGFTEAMDVADAHADGAEGHLVDAFLVDDTDATPDPGALGGAAPDRESVDTDGD